MSRTRILKLPTCGRSSSAPTVERALMSLLCDPFRSTGVQLEQILIEAILLCIMNTLKRGLLLAVSASGLAQGMAGEVIYFLVGPLSGNVEEASMVIPVSKPEQIEHARDLLIRGAWVDGELNRPFPVVRVRGGKNVINRDYLDPRLPEWSWHVEEVLDFADYAVEIIVMNPIALETRFDWSKDDGTVTSVWAFVWHTVTRELGPMPLYLSIVPDGQNLEFYWTGLGTNYFYTLEGKESLTSTNWLALPGGSWPLKTNHWTLPLTNATANFFRVRAEQSPQ